ncbi:MAG TPA: PAS domain S-box protein [Verrucomicrobiae bacterium]|nr:PAS domain S-box protein [Verrucomicrobiae bacterium]
MATEDNEDKLLRSVALQNANAILLARQRAERELFHAKEALERKTEELARALAMMRATLEATTDGILVTNAGGEITDFNQKFVDMWRLPPEAMETRQHRKLLDLPTHQFNDPEKVRARIEQIYASRPPETYDLLEFADGRVFERFTKVQFVNDRNVGRVWSFRDITEQKRAEQELRQQREWFQVTLSSIGDAVITTDTQGRVTFLNPVAEMMTGWKLAEALGLPLEEVFNIINEETRERVKSPVNKVLREGIVVGLANHTALIAKDGSERSIEDSAAPIKDASGKISGAVMVFHDVTERRRTEKALKEADKKKDEFLAILAHELRNPLVPIRNGLTILKLAGNDDHLAESARSMMDQALNQMIRLVDDLLDISRITTGKLHLRKERVELAAVVQSAMETSRPLMEEHGHKFTVILPSTPILLDADSTRLAQVFSNLLNNAAKYSENGGHIGLSAERRHDEIVVRVTDHGIGIPSDHLRRIFEMFAQVETDFVKAQGGLGIGLSLVKGLVEMHGGAIEACSEGPGTGSEFIVRLPAGSPVSGSSSANEAAEKASPAVRRRILIVDDNRLSSESTAMLLRLIGHDTATAHDGGEGLERAEAFRPEIVLLDIGLPGLNGYAVARRLREQPWGRNIFLIAVTGYGQEEDQRRSVEAGFDHHMVKPINMVELLEKLSEVGGA